MKKYDNKMHIKNKSLSNIINEIQNKCEYETRKPELLLGPKPIPMNIANKALKSICKIIIRMNTGNIYGTGFFMNNTILRGYLITNEHIISRNRENNDIEIEIYNNKKMKLNINDRDIKYFPQPKDITIIEIKNNDDIYNDIEFLDFDYNYIKYDYIIYKDIDVFSIEHPLGGVASIISGKIIEVKNYEFSHTISTDKGSSGCPIILLDNNINLLKVIGIHKEADYSENLNYGTFIGEIFNDNIYINDLHNINLNHHHDNNSDINIENYIIAKFDIKENDIYKEIRIINSYEGFKRNFNEELKEDFMNEKEIKKCKIRINNQLIPFNYYYKFPKKGKYTIKYSFNIYLTKTNYMFCKCDSLTELYLSNFNTQNVTDMSYMFSGCSSLKNIDLSKFDTQNVIDMSGMFYNCCSLKRIDLSNFNTQYVVNMSGMFDSCSSLTDINLSNFNTKNVKDMHYMFSGCSSLKILDLSNFNIQNVKDISGMFRECRLLNSLNLSNFKTQNLKEMSYMFLGCTSLKKENLIAKDDRIFQELHNN